MVSNRPTHWNPQMHKITLRSNHANQKRGKLAIPGVLNTFLLLLNTFRLVRIPGWAPPGEAGQRSSHFSGFCRVADFLANSKCAGLGTFNKNRLQQKVYNDPKATSFVLRSACGRPYPSNFFSTGHTKTAFSKIEISALGQHRDVDTGVAACRSE